MRKGWIGIAIILTLLVPPAWGQEQPAPADMLAAKQYAAYLDRLPEVLHGPDIEPLALLSVCIALDRSGRNIHDETLRIQAMLKPLPDALRNMAAIYHSLFLDVNKSEFFDPGETLKYPYTFWRDAAAMLRAHGYAPLADQAATVMLASPSLPITSQSQPLCLDGIRAAMHVPNGAQWFARVLSETEATHRQRRVSEIAELAFDQFIHPSAPRQADDPTPEAYFTFANALAEYLPGVYLSWAARLDDAGKRAEALECAQSAFRAAGDDRIRLFAACRLLENFGRPDLEETLLVRKLHTRHIPYDADLYHRYLDLLSQQKTTESLRKIAGAVGDPLSAADALVVLGEIKAAAKIYRTEMTAPGAPIQVRLYAWNGLLRVAPDDALRAMDGILDDLEKADSRAPLVRWTSAALCEATLKRLPLQNPIPRQPWEANLPAPAPGWETQAAAALGRLLAMEPGALLVPDHSRIPASLRLSIATVYAAARQPEQALKVLGQPVEGSDNAEKLHTSVKRSFPTPDELDDQMSALLTSFSISEATAEPLRLLADPVARHFAQRLATAADDETRHRAAQALADATRVALAATDKTGAAGQTTGMLAKQYQMVFAVPECAPAMVVVLRDGLQASVMQATTPAVREAAFTLLLETLTAYRKAVGAGVADGEAAFHAAVFEATKREELQPPAKRLRAAFSGGVQ